MVLPVAEVEPFGHTSQTLFPDDGANEPAGQVKQLLLPVMEYEPAEHSIHGDALLQFALQ